ncbi:MAG: serine/threonine-protein kinase [Pseudomonadota bacterium]
MVSESDADVFSTGTLVNNTYRIDKVLGRGGMGEVYLAAHDVTDQQVAIKVLRSEFTQDEMGVELMKREQAVRAVRHDAVIEYFELGRTAGGDVYLVMDFVEGPALDAAFKAGPLAPDQVLRLGRKIAEGLAACHERGVIHRDLSPDNILLRGGNSDHPVIIDFGIAKNTAAAADQTVIGGQFAGKFTYAPPEQFGGQVENRSDLYSLGVTMLAAVRGKAPSFGANQIEVMKNKGLPVDLSDVPEPLRGIIASLTDPTPDNRPSSAQDLVARIDRAIAGVPEPSAAPEMTVIAMPGGGTARAPDPLDDLGPAPAPPPPPRPSAEKTEFRLSGRHEEAAPRAKKKNGGGWIVLVLLLLLGGGGVGAWQAGLLDPLLQQVLGPERISPYRFVAKQEAGAVSIGGHVPSEADGQVLSGYLGSTYGAAESALALPVGAGAPTDQFSSAVLGILAPLEPLETWSMSLQDRRVTVTGIAPTTDAGEIARTALQALDGAEGLSISANISDGPSRLLPETLADLLAQGGECGPLALDPPSGDAFALGDTVRVRGEVADGRAGLAAREALQRAIGARTLDAELAVLNQPVCQVRRLLPPTPLSELSISFGIGADGGETPNPSGAFAVGDNPLIDISVPETDSWGHIHVAAVDVTGAVFHLLPNVNRPDTRLEGLGEVAEGVRTVRVAHTLEERANDASVIAFQIDETFGKTLIVAFHTREPLFGTLRPIAESAESFAAALESRIEARPLTGAEIETRMIDTRVE